MKPALGKRIIRIILTLFFLTAVLSSCNYSRPESTSPGITFPPGKDLTFETIGEPGNMGGPYEGENAQIRVITRTPLPEELEWVKPEERPDILKVDYSEYLVVMVFNGYRGGIFSQMKIKRIWQNDGTVFVLAHFNDFVPGATSLPASSSQYQVVRIDRTQITHSGTIIFKLSDEMGKERATVTSETAK